jgi:hypothetical protein
MQAIIAANQPTLLQQHLSKINEKGAEKYL